MRHIHTNTITKIASVVLISILVGIALFGFNSMAMVNHQPSGCIGASLQGNSCASQSDHDSPELHIAVLRNFFNAILEFITIIAVVLTSFLVLAKFSFIQYKLFPDSIFSEKVLVPIPDSLLFSRLPFKKWFSLHVNSAP